MFKKIRENANKMNRGARRAITAGALVFAGGALAFVTNYATVNRELTVSAVSLVTMESPEVLQQEFTARQEADELMAAIQSLDTVTLTSYAQISEVRESYEEASDAAKAYVDDAALRAAETEYGRLEAERETVLQEALTSGDLDRILDYAECEVTYSGDETLDGYVADFIAKATTPGMSRSEQLAACYDYMVANFSYEYNYNYSYDGRAKSIAWATCFLRDGYGACNNWNSAFMYIGRALGYDVKLCYGSTASSRGGGTEHYWPEFNLGGTTYVFDPQVEGDMTRKSGNNSHMRYGITGDTLESKYFFSTYID